VLEVDDDYRSKYFDNAATTPVDPQVVEEMLPFLVDSFGNANSIHEPGMRARAAVEMARRRVSELLGADDWGQIVFTSGATESNNWILAEYSKIGRGSVSPFEHSSVRESARHYGFSVLPNSGYDLSIKGVESGLVSVMSVNNETGARLGVLGAPQIHRHADITQQVGKLPIDLNGFGYASFSAHKFYGPKGVGGLYVGIPGIDPFHYGGEHEDGLRAGTLNVPGIVGMGAAAAIAVDEQVKNLERVKGLRALVLDAMEKVPDVQLNSPANSSPYIVNLSFLGVEGESLVIELDRAGFSISSGAACSSKSVEPSEVLTALGVPAEWIRGTVRISFGKYNTEAATTSLAKELRTAVEKLRTMQ
jgi:cysteine desulfurase